jgi:hypothetical protein
MEPIALAGFSRRDRPYPLRAEPARRGRAVLRTGEGTAPAAENVELFSRRRRSVVRAAGRRVS